MSELKTIKISNILTDLEEGRDRKAIGEKYNISAAEVKAIFQHEKLKNKKVKKIVVPTYQLLDDTIEKVESAEEVKEIINPDKIETVEKAKEPIASGQNLADMFNNEKLNISDEEKKVVAGESFG